MAETGVFMVLLLAVGFLKSDLFLIYFQMLTSTFPVVLLTLKSINLESIQECSSTVFHLVSREQPSPSFANNCYSILSSQRLRYGELSNLETLFHPLMTVVWAPQPFPSSVRWNIALFQLLKQSEFCEYVLLRSSKLIADSVPVSCCVITLTTYTAMMNMWRKNSICVSGSIHMCTLFYTLILLHFLDFVEKKNDKPIRRPRV